MNVTVHTNRQSHVNKCKKCFDMFFTAFIASLEFILERKRLGKRWIEEEGLAATRANMDEYNFDLIQFTGTV